MNIEESVEYLKNCLNDEYNFKNATRKKDKEAIETLLTAYEKEKEINKNLEQENSFLKMMYRGTDEFKAIENLAKEE